MSSENYTLRATWLAVSPTSVLFRCNTGRAWISGAGKAWRQKDGSVVVPAARPIALGLSFPNGDPVVGTSDLLGYTEVTVTAEMVGAVLPVFTSIEAKKADGGRRRPDQVTFCNNIAAAGGISGFASSPEEGKAIIADWHKKFIKKD